MALTHDGSRALTSSDDGTAKLWDLTKPRPHLLAALNNGHAKVYAVALTHDGGRALIGSADGTADLWTA